MGLINGFQIGVISIGDAVRALICSEEGESTFIPEDIDVAFHNEEVPKAPVLLDCSYSQQTASVSCCLSVSCYLSLAVCLLQE